MSLSLIVAMGRNRVIGNNNRLPWHLPEDLAYFKRVTSGHTVLMGRKTFESIGRPLPNRRNVVITRDPTYRASGCDVVHSLREAVDRHRDDEIFVIGGAEIYRQALPLADKLYVTYIDEDFEGDRYFPELEPLEWKLVSEVPGTGNDDNPYSYTFRVYERKREREN